MSNPQTDKAAGLDWFGLLKELADPWVIALSICFAILELGNASVLPAWINREKSVEAEAVGQNAEDLRQGLAARAEQKSLTAAAEAEYAPRKEAAIARRAKAMADVTAAEAQIASASATNSPVKMKADAEAEAALADLTKQQELVEAEKARQANRKVRAELEIEQIKLATSKVTTMMGKMQLQICADCDPNYCVLCEKHYVPDLPSGAELPPLPGDPPPPPAPKPVITDLVRMFPWQANSPNDNVYQQWRASLPYGAIAVGGNNDWKVGFCSSKPDLATAKQCAIEDCGYTNCQVVSEMTDAGAAPPSNPTEPAAEPVLTRIHRQLFPLGGGCRDSFDSWKTSPPFGAFAVSSDHCGFSHGREDLETAKRDALKSCGDDTCYLVYQTTKKEVPATPPAAGDAGHAYGTVAAEQLNVHAGPNKDSAVVGQLKQGQKVEITAQAEGDYIAIKATCIDGKSCDGYVNGRAEFVTRQAAADHE